MKCVLFQNRERTKGSHKKFSIDFDDIYQRIAVNSNLLLIVESQHLSKKNSQNCD